MEEYKDCYVAFIDILGFKIFLEKYGYEDIKGIFEDILTFKPHSLIEVADLYANINSYVMSDSIVLYIETRHKGAFVALTDACLQMQIKLSMHNPPILVRGGISIGKLYHNGTVIFGTGLSKAYVLESSLAKFPRIIFLEETRQAALPDMDKMYIFDYDNMFYLKDEDMLYYIDYMNTFDYIPSLEEISKEKIIAFDNDYFDNLYKFAKRQLAELTDITIREKYLWLFKKIEQAIEGKPEVKKYFDEQKKTEQELMEKRFDFVISNELEEDEG